jgi:hypothetical protein
LIVTSKARIALGLLIIVVIGMTVVVLVKARTPKAIAPIEPITRSSAVTALVAKPHADSAPPKTTVANTVEVCGHGEVQIDKNDPGALYQQVGAFTKGVAARWLSTLQDSDDLRARMAGLVLEGKVTGGESMRPVAEQTRNEAVQLAAGSQDPAVYAMALSMCDRIATADADSACRQLSAQQWTKIDPDNAVPWLLLADKARASHDDVAEGDAFSHAAAAAKIDSYSDSVFAFAAPELPQDVTPLDRSYLFTEVIGVEAGYGLPFYGVASHHCSGEAMQNGTVRQQCASLAELLVTKGTTLLDFAVGASIGTRAGWPRDRVSKLLLEQHAFMQAIVERTFADDDKRWTCGAVNRLNAYVVQKVRLGELGAAREELERSGESVEAMAQKYTDYIDNMRRDAVRRQRLQQSTD